MSDQIGLLQDLIARARAAGADAADAVLVSGASLGVQRRLGETEHVERSEGRDLGLRVFLGQRAAIVSSTAVDPAGFTQLAERAVAMARVVPEDPYSGLAAEASTADAGPLDLADPSEPDAEALLTRAAAAEEAALAVAGITNSEGASAGYGRTEIYLVTSDGFAGGFSRTSHSVSATALAGAGTRMQRDYDYSSAVHLDDLENAAAIGRSAGERAISRLNPSRPRTAKLPVVYDPRVAGGLLGHLSGAINGGSVARGTTFLKEKLGARIFPPGSPCMTIRCDDAAFARARSMARACPPRRAPSSRTACLPRGCSTAARRASSASPRLVMPRAAPAARPRPRPRTSTWRRARCRPPR